MTFEYPDYLWLLLFAPAMALFFWWSWKTRQRLMMRFMQTRLLSELVAGISPTRQKIRAGFFIGAVVCLIIALARPQWGYDLDEVRQRGLDIMVAIDTSKSMLAEDIAPNRLARAKLAVLDLMQQAKFDRLGLIAFAGTAFLQCPLTIDDAAFRQSVELLDVNTLPEGGTAIAQAIDTAVKSFKGEDNHRVLVLFSDGEDQNSGALEAARKAADAGVRVFTIGIGSAAGELLRVQTANGQTDYIRDENGNVVKSHLNEQLLQQIATTTDGYYLPLRGADTMDVLYDRFLAPLPKSDFKEKWVRRPRERYHWPLALAILLLTAEILLPERKRQRRSVAVNKEPPRPVLAQTALFVLLLLPLAARASTAGALREYKSGNYTKAYEEYEHLLRKNADDARLHFNAGAAAYRDQQFSTAARHFGEALHSQDLKLQEQAYYNMGNALFRLGEQSADPSKKSEAWEQSLTNYVSGLKLDANDADAKHNYEFVKQQLEELKKQQQQQQNQNDQSKQTKDQQQQSQQAKNDQQQKDSESQSQQNQKQNPSQQSQQEAANQKRGHDKEQAQSQPQQQQSKEQQSQEAQSNDQKKEQNNPSQAAEANVNASGEMTSQQAERLLDAQKEDEKMLPWRPAGNSTPQQRPIRDW